MTINIERNGMEKLSTLTAPEDVIVEIQEGVEWAPIQVLHICDRHWCQPVRSKYCCVNIQFTTSTINSQIETYWEGKMM